MGSSWMGLVKLRYHIFHFVVVVNIYCGGDFIFFLGLHCCLDSLEELFDGLGVVMGECPQGA